MRTRSDVPLTVLLSGATTQLAAALESGALDAPQQRVWDVLSDLEARPQRMETVDVV